MQDEGDSTTRLRARIAKLHWRILSDHGTFTSVRDDPTGGCFDAFDTGDYIGCLDAAVLMYDCLHVRREHRFGVMRGVLHRRTALKGTESSDALPTGDAPSLLGDSEEPDSAVRLDHRAA
jgi:hypothetical protein